MKKLMSLAGLTELARAYLKSAWIASPQWDSVKKRWVHISPNGTATSSCGAPDFTGIPKTDTDIKRHQRLMWQRCQRCGLIRPWGGCARNTVPYTKEWFPGGQR
ncbi:hypothetical protein C6499_22820 [Candidatus Poribacteria bacterium]|nr:MAG: hypothetical protein C6499_22820 [Candidatus Poribacteria bacterium]